MSKPALFQVAAITIMGKGSSGQHIAKQIWSDSHKILNYDCS